MSITPLTAKVERFVSPDGIVYYVGTLVEHPGVVVEEESEDAAYVALREEVRSLNLHLGRRDYIPTATCEWVSRTYNAFDDVQPGTYVGLGWATARHATAVRPERDTPQRNLWGDAICH